MNVVLGEPERKKARGRESVNDDERTTIEPKIPNKNTSIKLTITYYNSPNYLHNTYAHTNY